MLTLGRMADQMSVDALKVKHIGGAVVSSPIEYVKIALEKDGVLFWLIVQCLISGDVLPLGIWRVFTTEYPMLKTAGMAEYSLPTIPGDLPLLRRLMAELDKVNAQLWKIQELIHQLNSPPGDDAIRTVAEAAWNIRQLNLDRNGLIRAIDRWAVMTSDWAQTRKRKP